MGLSVAISGGIILTVFVLILLSFPGFVDKMFSIGDVTSQVAQFDKSISDTEISMNYLSELVGSSKVNFTLNNDGSEKLWNFIDFDLFIEYVGTLSGKRTEELSYNGECLGAVPQAGNWCIQSISNDIADPKILNSGEQARIWTNLSDTLASTTAIVTLVTDNGVTFTTAGSSINTLESLTNVTDTGCALNQIIKVNSTGFWDCADYPIIRISGTPGAAGSDITYQVLTANSVDCNTVALCTVMSTTGLGSGTWKFKYTIIYQSAAAGTGIGFGTDATGVVTLYRAQWTHVTTGAGAATGVGDDVTATVAGQMAEGKSGATDNAVIGSTSTGVATANTNTLAVLEGIYSTTSSGNLDFKISSENAGTNVRVMAGTMLELYKIA